MSAQTEQRALRPTASIRFNQGVLEQLWEDRLGTRWLPVLDIDPPCSRLSDAVQDSAECVQADDADSQAAEIDRTGRELVRAVDDIRRVFGAPGDYGYETARGGALNKLYTAAYALARARCRGQGLRS